MLRRGALLRTEFRNVGSYSTFRSLLLLLLTANLVPSSPILFTLMTEAICSSETSVLKRATRRNIQEGGIHHSHCREYINYFDSYVTVLKGIWKLSIFFETLWIVGVQRCLGNFQYR
jgi:hypothetical protein